jgi:hypothetical protein
MRHQHEADTRGKAQMAYGKCAILEFTEDAKELERRMQAEVVPIFRQHKGFIAYGAIFMDGQVLSITAWESEEDYKAADAAVKDWFKGTSMTATNRYFGDFAWLEFAQK